MVDEIYLNLLRDRKLVVSHHVPAFRDGVWVVKPTTTEGNFIPNFETGFAHREGELPCPDTDAPMLKFIRDGNKWQVFGWDGVGGMVPGDFLNEWNTAEEAIADILEFYFGDPTRMKAKEAYFSDPAGEIKRARSEGRMPKSPYP